MERVEKRVKERSEGQDILSGKISLSNECGSAFFNQKRAEIVIKIRVFTPLRMVFH